MTEIGIGDYSNQPPLRPDAVMGEADKKAFRDSRTDADLGDAFLGIFDEFSAYVAEGDPSYRNAHDSVMLDVAHPDLGTHFIMNLSRPTNIEDVTQRSLEGEYGATDAAFAPLVSIDLFVPVERESEDLTVDPAQAVVELATGGAVEVETSEHEDEALVTGSSPSHSFGLDASVDAHPLTRAHIMNIDLGVVTSLDEASEFGVDTTDFEGAFPDDAQRYRAALGEFAETHSNDSLGTIHDIDTKYALWQVRENRLIAVDARVSRSASLGPETDRAVVDAREVLTHLIGQMDEDMGIDPDQLMTTSSEGRTEGDPWLGDEVGHRVVGAPLEREILRLLNDSEFVPINQNPGKLGSGTQLPLTR